MIIRVLCLSCFYMFTACSQIEKPAAVAEAPVEEDRFTPVMIQIAQMVEPGFSSAGEFSNIFNCYLVTVEGSAQQVTDSAAIAVYLRIMEEEKDAVTQAPIFEVKNSDHLVLLVKEKNSWANILLDTESMTIVDIQFPTGSAAAKLGNNAEKFRQQFNGAAVSFSPDNFELTPWDDQIPAKGEVTIDGISGATKICQASVDMLNNQLPFYRAYFESSIDQPMESPSALF